MTRRPTIVRFATAAVLLLIGVLLPWLVRLAGLSDRVLLPMQIPVALAGFLLPMNWAVSCGVLIPILNSALFDIPFLTGDLSLWICQMIALAAFANFYYDMLGQNILVSMLCAEMLSFVVLFCAASIFYAVTPGGMRALPYFRGAVGAGWPGIVLLVVLVPILVTLVERVKDRWGGVKQPER